MARLLREHRLTVAKQDKQIGAAVIVDVNDRASVLVGGGIEFLDEIDLTVEIAVRLATENRTARIVELLNIGPTVQVTIEGELCQAPGLIVMAPGIRAAVMIAIFGEDAPSF